MIHKHVLTAFFCAATTLSAVSADADGIFRGGGVRGADGGTVFAGRAAGRITEGQSQYGKFRAVRGPNNRTALRGRNVTRNADGTISGHRGFGVSGERGALSNAIDVSGNGDGTAKRVRTQTVTNSETGNSVVRSSTFDGATQSGSRSVTCLDGSGAEISC